MRGELGVRIYAIHPADAGFLADVYNRQVVPAVPYCFPVTADEFLAGIVLRDDVGAVYDMDLDRIVVGEEHGKVQAFCHITAGTIGSNDSDDRLTGRFIHFFTYEPGTRRVAQAVLAESERMINGVAPGPIRAFCGYSYTFHHVGTPCLSDRLGHVYALLKSNGYQLWGTKQIFLDQEISELDTPGVPEQDAQVTVETTAGGMLPGIVVKKQAHFRF